MFIRLLSAFVLFFGLSIASQSQAHSVLVSSNPVAKAAVESGPILLSLVFDSRVDPKRSRLYLSKPDGTKDTLLPEAGATKGTLVAKVELSSPGAYQLTYEVLSIDGHIARGLLPFTVTDKK